MKPRRIVLWTVRLLALGCGALGLWFLGSDLVRSAGEGRLGFKPLGQAWYEADAGSLNLAQAVIERYLFPELWHPVITTLLNWPAWVVPLALAAILGICVRPGRQVVAGG